jgi:hypothetical protein
MMPPEHTPAPTPAPQPPELGLGFQFDRLRQQALIRLTVADDKGRTVSVAMQLDAGGIEALYKVTLAAVMQLNVPAGAIPAPGRMQ